VAPARRSDGEKPNRALRVRYLHGYHGVVPPMPLIAPFARVARSTNRFHALTWRSPFASYRTLWPPSQSAQARARWHKAAQESQVLLTAKPRELNYQHEIIRWINQERDQAPAVRAEM
jgi:hypothetical protein